VSVADRQGGLDECGVGEGLGVVAEVTLVLGVDLLGQEAERVDEFQEVGEQLGRLVDPAGAGEGLDQPERRGKAPSVRAAPMPMLASRGQA
jgi:hypothetical protein